MLCCATLCLPRRKLLEEPPPHPLATFVCGDDAQAVEVVMALVEHIQPFVAVNAGGPYEIHKFNIHGANRTHGTDSNCRPALARACSC